MVLWTKRVSGVNISPSKIFCERSNKERNTQVNVKDKNADKKMENYQIQYDLIGINRNIGF